MHRGLSIEGRAGPEERAVRTQIGVMDLTECCRPVGRPGITDDEAEALATLFRALGDPGRIRIFNLLSIRPR